LKARGKVYLGVELEMIYLGTSKGRRSRHRNLFLYTTATTMSDPLSIAASVAGLLSLAGTASKSIFQFISSIADAPEQARHLTRELYALNVALGQVQGSLLDPRFSTENDDSSDISMLHECLASCTTVFSELENRLRNAGLTEESLGSRSVGSFQRGWKSVKWSFTDDELRELLRRVEAEKATLGLINNAFAAYVDLRSMLVWNLLIPICKFSKLTAGILGCLKETKTQMRRMNRRLKNVQVILEWVAQKSCQQNTNHNQGSSTPMIFSPDDFLESSVVTASTSYGPGELANLLQSTSSVLSLTLETNLDDTVTVQWSPAEAAAPQRSSAAEIRLGTPQWSTDNGSNLFDSTEIIPMLQSRRFGTLDVLEKINPYEAVIDTFLSPPSFASLAWGVSQLHKSNITL
jgi:hypothetical protein